MNIFSERLKELRIEQNLSQYELSVKLDKKISDTAIGNWEREERLPRLDSLIILANYFKVSIDYLASLED